MADFSKGSGNSIKGVEMIAVVRPNNVAYKTDKETGEKTAAAAYVDVQVNNSALTKADVAAGKGQAHPNLYTKNTTYTDKDTGETKSGTEHGIRMSMSQLEAIEAAGKGKSLTKEDGTKYIPFKADVMGLKETVKGEDGKPVMDKDGKPQTKNVGMMPNTKTIQPTELGTLTQNRLDKHFANTKAINDVQKAQKDAAKEAKLEAAASMSAPTAEKSDAKGMEK